MPKKITINGRNVADVYCRKNDKTVRMLIKDFRQGYARLEKFFQFRIPKVTIRLLYSRQQFNELAKKETPMWVVGWAKNNDVYVLSPSACRAHSCHTAAHMRKVLVHEVAHIFIRKVNSFPAKWLDEGLALVLAEQNKGQFSKENWEWFKRQNFIVNVKFDWWKAAKRNGYSISCWFVKFLLREYGREMVMRFLQVSPQKGKPAAQFREILGRSHRELEKEFEGAGNFAKMRAK